MGVQLGLILLLGGLVVWDDVQLGLHLLLGEDVVQLGLFLLLVYWVVWVGVQLGLHFLLRGGEVQFGSAVVRLGLGAFLGWSGVHLGYLLHFSQVCLVQLGPLASVSVCLIFWMLIYAHSCDYPGLQPT